MKILIAAPPTNFDLAKIKQKIAKNFKSDEFFYLDSALSNQQLEQIEVLVGNDQQILEKILALPNNHLRWVQALSAGIDYLPLKKLQQSHILLTTLKGLHAEPIAETILGMILSSYRGIVNSARHQSWQKPPRKSHLIKNKRVVIFGTGHIGSRTAELLQAFGAQVSGVNHNGHPAANFLQTVSTQDSLQLAADAQIIINTMPLTSATKDYFNAGFFKHLTKQPLFISIGRGPSTNTADLITALKKQQLSAAALDVTDPEPLPADNPLWQMGNALISPHISGIYSEYTIEAIELFHTNLQYFHQDGTVAINQVDFNKGY